MTVVDRLSRHALGTTCRIWQTENCCRPDLRAERRYRRPDEAVEVDRRRRSIARVLARGRGR